MNQNGSSIKDMLQGGTQLNGGKYRIVRHLASGGFGNTYEAVNTTLEAKCAIKEFFMSGVNHRDNDTYTVKVSNSAMTSIFESSKAKFKKEAQRIYKLHNDHIVRVHDLFEENNTVYYVMDFVEGKSLSQVMKAQGHPFSEAQVRDILLQMTDALRCIHGQNLWHMDIKPGNIMMDTSGRCTLIDFGASKQTYTDNSVTTSSAIAQTPGYAPSEQVNGNKDYWGPWTDIYALGATAYNLLTGNRPPLRDNIDVLKEKAFSFPETVSQPMRNLSMSMMQPVYVNRPQTVDEVEALLPKRDSDVYMGGKTPDDDSNKTIYRVDNVPKGVPPTSSSDETFVGRADKSFDVNGITFKMVFVQGGTFTMGATSEQGSDAHDDEKPAHRVTLSNYYIGQTEVTQELWQAVMGSNPSYFKGGKRPVECVSWDDCQTFIRKLNSLAGENFRLPAEAEWEFAARGGNSSRGYKYAGSNNLTDVAWYWQNSGKKYLSGTDHDWDRGKIDSNKCQTHNVATKSPNELGIYDMSGNVWEWCQDWYGENYYAQSPSFNPQGPSWGFFRVHRGGSWINYARNCRVANRYRNYPANRINFLGFRLAF